MEHYSLLLGYIPATMFIAMVLFAAIGVSIRLLIDAVGRNQNSPATPYKFSILFLLRDNWKTILLTFIAILVVLRFAASIFDEQFTAENLDLPATKEKWLFGSLMVGIAFNHVIQILKEKSDLLKVKR